MKATVLDMENRINTLRGRGKENGNIVKKLLRRIRKEKSKEI